MNTWRAKEEAETLTLFQEKKGKSQGSLDIGYKL